MEIDLDFNKNELSKIGILDTYIKRKLKHYFSKNLNIKINPKIQTRIINDYLDVLKLPRISSRSDDEYYTIENKYDKRPDLLAYDFFTHFYI